MDEEYEREEDKGIEDKPEEKIDHISKFMFGRNHLFRRNTVESNEPSIERKRVKGDAWILGFNNVDEEEEYTAPNENNNDNTDAIANYISQIDLDLLMKNVDMFMSSANELKPLFKKITPLLKKWMD